MKIVVTADDGTLLFSADTKATAPAPAAGAALAGAYFTGADLTAAVSAAKPKYKVLVDRDDAAGVAGLSGSGTLLPAIRYGSQDPAKYPNPVIILMNPDHPYFSESKNADLVKSQVLSAPVVSATRKAVVAGQNPLTVWETAKSTLDPPLMMVLLHWMGYGDTAQQVKDYRKFYYTTYGRQAPGGPTNRENLTDAEIAAIIQG